MGVSMNKAMSSAFFLLFGSFSLQAVEGAYNVSGFDPNTNTSYTGTVTITKGENEIYDAEWNLSLDPPKYLGKGLKSDNQISFLYQTDGKPFGADTTGLQVYKIKGDTLEGNFIVYGESLVGNETLTKK